MEKNNSNLNDVVQKFNNILKEKNIDLNKILGNEESKNQPLDFDFDLDTIIKFKNIYQKINDANNPRNRLLYSLKPLIRAVKQTEYIQKKEIRWISTNCKSFGSY